jgi:uncharacterized RDD family membrane protein YckC
METLTTEIPVNYATFWQRVGACLIDIIIISLPSIVFWAVATFMLKMDAKSVEYNAISQAVSLVITVLYYSLFESSAKQGTWGKQMLELRVVDMTGERIDIGTAFTRTLVKSAPSIIILAGLFVFGMPPVNPNGMPEFSSPAYILQMSMLVISFVCYLTAAFTARRQAIHDLVAGTVVLKRATGGDAW